MAAEQNIRTPSNEPTLMIGDLPLDTDLTFVDELVLGTFPKPVKFRKSATKNEKNLNVFYQYECFDDAKIALRILNGRRVPGMPQDFRLDMNFTMQELEACAHFSICNVHFDRFEVLKLFYKYNSVLGLAQHQTKLWNKTTPKTTSFIRFGDYEECMQSIREFNGFPIDGWRIYMTPSTRYIDLLNEYVLSREAIKTKYGIPEFQSVYSKTEVDVNKFNEIIMTTSSDFFNDLEGSRWSSIVYKTDTQVMDYNREMTLSYFENCF